MPSTISPLLSEEAVRLDTLLPQQQCKRCGYTDCGHYAQSLALRQTSPDRCAPGGVALAKQLAAASGLALLTDAVFDADGLTCARIDEATCIGCTRCLRVCPLDALIGAPKRLHAVLPTLCSGCGLCLPACPVDCIVLIPVTRVWNVDDANAARARYQGRLIRQANALPVAQRVTGKSSTVAAASLSSADMRQHAIAQALAAARMRRAQHR